MYLSVYRFRGDPAALHTAHARLLAAIPPASLQLHLAVTRPQGLDVYDSCPSLAVAESFSSGDTFGQMLAAAGLPRPEVERLGDIGAAVLEGRRVG